MLRWMQYFIAGNWDSANSGFTAILFRTSCTQDLRCVTVHTFLLNRFLTVLVSPLGFPSRWGQCPSRLFTLDLLPLWGHSPYAEAAHVFVPPAIRERCQPM
jgi:hypothetical protein